MQPYQICILVLVVLTLVILVIINTCKRTTIPEPYKYLADPVWGQKCPSISVQKNTGPGSKTIKSKWSPLGGSVSWNDDGVEQAYIVIQIPRSYIVADELLNRYYLTAVQLSASIPQLKILIDEAIPTTYSYGAILTKNSMVPINTWTQAGDGQFDSKSKTFLKETDVEPVMGINAWNTPNMYTTSKFLKNPVKPEDNNNLFLDPTPYSDAGTIADFFNESYSTNSGNYITGSKRSGDMLSWSIEPKTFSIIQDDNVAQARFSDQGCKQTSISGDCGASPSLAYYSDQNICHFENQGCRMKDFRSFQPKIMRELQSYELFYFLQPQITPGSTQDPLKDQHNFTSVNDINREIDKYIPRNNPSEVVHTPLLSGIPMSTVGNKIRLVGKNVNDGSDNSTGLSQYQRLNLLGYDGDILNQVDDEYNITNTVFTNARISSLLGGVDTPNDIFNRLNTALIPGFYKDPYYFHRSIAGYMGSDFDLKDDIIPYSQQIRVKYSNPYLDSIVPESEPVDKLCILYKTHLNTGKSDPTDIQKQDHLDDGEAYITWIGSKGNDTKTGVSSYYYLHYPNSTTDKPRWFPMVNIYPSAQDGCEYQGAAQLNTYTVSPEYEGVKNTADRLELKKHISQMSMSIDTEMFDKLGGMLFANTGTDPLDNCVTTLTGYLKGNGLVVPKSSTDRPKAPPKCIRTYDYAVETKYYEGKYRTLWRTVDSNYTDTINVGLVAYGNSNRKNFIRKKAAIAAGIPSTVDALFTTIEYTANEIESSINSTKTVNLEGCDPDLLSTDAIKPYISRYEVVQQTDAPVFYSFFPPEAFELFPSNNPDGSLFTNPNVSEYADPYWKSRNTSFGTANIKHPDMKYIFRKDFFLDLIPEITDRIQTNNETIVGRMYGAEVSLPDVIRGFVLSSSGETPVVQQTPVVQTASVETPVVQTARIGVTFELFDYQDNNANFYKPTLKYNMIINNYTVGFNGDLSTSVPNFEDTSFISKIEPDFQMIYQIGGKNGDGVKFMDCNTLVEMDTTMKDFIHQGVAFDLEYISGSVNITTFTNYLIRIIKMLQLANKRVIFLTGNSNLLNHSNRWHKSETLSKYQVDIMFDLLQANNIWNTVDLILVKVTDENNNVTTQSLSSISGGGFGEDICSKMFPQGIAPVSSRRIILAPYEAYTKLDGSVLCQGQSLAEGSDFYVNNKCGNLFETESYFLM